MSDAIIESDQCCHLIQLTCQYCHKEWKASSHVTHFIVMHLIYPFHISYQNYLIQISGHHFMT